MVVIINVERHKNLVRINSTNNGQNSTIKDNTSADIHVHACWTFLRVNKGIASCVWLYRGWRSYINDREI